MRAVARRRFRAWRDRRAEPLDDTRFARPTLVLAPHPDDETLGCGGLVAQLRDRATPVSIVFLTDGAASHAGTGDLGAQRRREAAAAAAVLGVGAEQLHFLDHPDGRLEHFVDRASSQVAELFDGCRFDQVVLPHPAEPNRDHAATYRIAVGAAGTLDRTIDSLQFGVWVWDQWPWTDPLAPPRERHGRRQMVEVAIRGGLGLANVRRFETFVDVGEQLPRKRAALAQHVSQMTRPDDHPEHPTLSDVADGEWLDLLMGPREYFHAAELTPAPGNPS